MMLALCMFRFLSVVLCYSWISVDCDHHYNQFRDFLSTCVVDKDIHSFDIQRLLKQHFMHVFVYIGIYWIGPLPWDDFHAVCNRLHSPEIRCSIISCGRGFHCGLFSHLWYRSISMSEFDQLLSVRVGEASHPGPSNVKIAVINPTAVYGKIDEILDVGADVVVCAETSLTSHAQKSCQWHFDKHGFKCFWSCPVKSKKNLGDDRPSFRGEAAGTAILSKLESRQHRFTYKAEIWQSCRISSAVVRIRSFEILVVALYGFPDRNAQAMRLNDILLAHAYEVATKTGLPFIIAGDINTDVHQLPCFQNFLSLGCVEIFAHSRNAWGVQLPATCRGATFNDTMIIHPFLIPFLAQAQVSDSHVFEPHSPMILTLNVFSDTPMKLIWDIPKSWREFHPKIDRIAEEYDQCWSHFDFLQHEVRNEEDVDYVLHQWSQAAECAVDGAIRSEFRFNPLEMPIPGLPETHKGRCRPRKTIQKTAHTGPKGDRHGGFNPEVEVFSCVVKQKVRQLRRLMSYQRACQSCVRQYGDLGHDRPPFRQLYQEWQRILHAAGYGRAWFRWILSFEVIHHIPLGLPSMDLLDKCICITKVDTEAACQQESQSRAQRFKYSISLDNSEGFGKTTYTIMKNLNNAKLTEVPHQVSMHATLCRAMKGTILLRLDEYKPFRTNQSATFGDAHIVIVSQQGCTLTIKTVEGSLPTQALVSQHQIATSPQEIFQVFQDFWAPYWLRETQVEEQGGHCWKDFQDELELCDFPQCDVQIDLSDTQLWLDTIAQLPNGKAEGVCGWRYEEIKDLPKRAVEHLATIFSRIWAVGFSSRLMQARTTLLAKVECPTSMNHGRPITVLSALYRLVTKILYNKISNVWAQILPSAISGGLPSRGVRDLAFEQNFCIEQHVHEKKELCGVSIDLSKAFNMVPRYPACVLLEKLGVPQHIIKFWAKSMSRLARVVLIRGQIGPMVYSTSGVPEGDSFSVLIMVALSTFFYYRLHGPRLWPSAYADNWSWMSTSDRECFRAFIKVMNITRSLRMLVDIAKSWVWGTSKTMKDAVKNFDVLFPQSPGCLTLKNNVRDLGEIVQYNKAKVAQPIVSRITQGKKRIEKLQSLPLTLQQKCERIQASGWSYSLYGADTHYLGKTHFHGLRQSALKALGAYQKTASPWLACTVISRHLMDPFLWVVLCMLRCIRRLAVISRDRAKVFLAFVVSCNGIYPFGPATTFAKYLEVLQWTVDCDGNLHTYFDDCANILQDSAKKIKQVVTRAFHEFVFQQVDSRRGIPEERIDVELLHKTLEKLKDEDQKILLLNLVGGYQSNTIKAMWNSDIDTKCDCCDQQDHVDHRMLFCPALQHIRDAHPEAVKILSEYRPSWIYHPFPTLCDELRVINAINRCIAIPHPNVLHQVDHPSHLNLFTDGGCEFPNDYTSRRASWAVVADFSPTREVAMDASVQAQFNSDYKHPCMKCVATGMVSQEQTAGRGEIISVLQAIRYVVDAETCESASIFTDAQYVLNITQQIQQNCLDPRTDHIQNWDIVEELQRLWFCKPISVFKVKSHRDVSSACDMYDLWTIIGNNLADVTATSSLQRIHSDIKQLYRDAHRYRENESSFLKKVLLYIVALNRERSNILKQSESSDLQARRDRVADERNNGEHTPIHLLLQYVVSESDVYIHDCPDFAVNWAISCLQGANLAKAVWGWSKTLKWPRGPVDPRTPASWGVSFFELLVNFHICTGYMPPIRIQGQGSSSVYIDYFSDMALLQGSSKRSMGAMVFGFQALIRAISSVAGGPILPVFHQKVGTSIYRLGFRGKMPSIPIRPEMCQNNLTMQTVYAYIQKLENPKSLSLPLEILQVEPCLTFQSIDEPSVDERYKNYQRWVKRRGRERL